MGGGGAGLRGAQRGRGCIIPFWLGLKSLVCCAVVACSCGNGAACVLPGGLGSRRRPLIYPTAQCYVPTNLSPSSSPRQEQPQLTLPLSTTTPPRQLHTSTLAQYSPPPLPLSPPSLSPIKTANLTPTSLALPLIYPISHRQVPTYLNPLV